MPNSAQPPAAHANLGDRRRIVPTRFQYSLHAFNGPSLDLRLDGDRLEFRRSADGYMASMTEPRIVTPSLAAWRQFRAELDEIPIWSWKTIRTSSGVLDGANWEIDILYADRRKRLSGYHEMPKHFRRFEHALARLLGLRRLEGEPFTLQS